jgi:hypothetical protein
MHPHISTHIFCYYPESMNPHIFHSDPLRKLFYSYSRSELQKYIYSCHSFLSLASKKKAPNIPFCYPLSIYPKRGLGAPLKKEERGRERERKVKERGQMS